MKSGIYFFKKQGTASLLVASSHEPKQVRSYYKRAGYTEMPVQRNKNRIPIISKGVSIIRQDSMKTG